MCNEREDPAPGKGRDWLASGLWSLFAVGVFVGLAALALKGESRALLAWLGVPFLLPALSLLLVAAGVLPGRWVEFLAGLVPPDWQMAIFLALCVLAWWAFLAVCAYPICRARRLNRSATRLLEAAP